MTEKLAKDARKGTVFAAEHGRDMQASAYSSLDGTTMKHPQVSNTKSLGPDFSTSDPQIARFSQDYPRSREKYS